MELCSKEETLDKALSVLEAMGVGPVDYSYIRKESPSLVLIYVSSDVRETVLNLTEAGFTIIKGINPILKVQGIASH